MGTGILYVDDHEVFHECVRHMFSLREDMDILAIASNGQSAVRLAGELRPEVVVMDVRLPGLNGIEATRKILEDQPQARVIGLSGYTDRQTVLAMIKAGASGYVVKEAAFGELIQAIEAVVAGKMYLSPGITSVMLEEILAPSQFAQPAVGLVLSSREREVLRLVAEGLSSKEIADRLCVSPKTIETHRARIMKKLGLKTFADLVKYAVREGLTSL
ncbi:response regulator [Trichloromonas sp.]|uniref:response regulator n=1 Tax=Trichloromonas sp. TaxID=3069249 RepID=UPI003D812673